MTNKEIEGKILNSRDEEFVKLKEEYKKVSMPKEGMNKVEEAIWRAKMDKKRQRRRKTIRNVGLCTAAAAVVIVGLPNFHADIAYAMGNLPLVGGFFQVVTIRNYQYDDGNHTANVDIPDVSVKGGETESNGVNSQAVQQVNKSAEEYVSQLIEQFQADITEEGYRGLDVSYETITDTDTWFTLKISAVETKGSGYEFYRFYHIDKAQDKVMELKDLFADNPDYVFVISNEIKKQMKEQMDAGTSVYFIEDSEVPDGFFQIKEDENFYINANGNLVIVFNEYEVGPGCIGCPEFVMPDEIFKR